LTAPSRVVESDAVRAERTFVHPKEDAVSRRSSVALTTLLAAVALLALAPSQQARGGSTGPVHLVGADLTTALDVFPATVSSTSLAGADRPAILLFPGWNTGEAQYTQLRKYLTDRGYVVAVFSHGGNLDPLAEDWAIYAETAMNLLVVEATSPASPLFHEVDAKRIGVAGHSLGAATAVLLASRDKRVKALGITGPQCGTMSFLAAAPLVTCPVLTVDGSLDRIAPPEVCSAGVIAGVSATDKASVIIKDGNHTNSPSDYNFDYIRDTGRLVMKTTTIWPYFYWTWDWPVVAGIKPIPGAQQRAIAFPYRGAWFDRYVAGIKPPAGVTNGKQADAQVQQGVLTKDFFSAAARSGP
jgi:dienelactone hydrolase